MAQAHSGSDTQFRVRSLLGEGANGPIYRADVTRRGGTERVALQILDPALSTDGRHLTHVKKLTRALAGSTHPALPGVEGLVEVDGTWLLVLDRLQGTPLSGWVDAKRGTGVPIGIALQAIREAARGLDALSHVVDPKGRAVAVGIGPIHPGSLLLEPSGRVRLLDLGLRKPHDADKTEAVQDLCLTLIQLVTGRRPQRGTPAPQLDRELADVGLPVGVRTLLREANAAEAWRRPSPQVLARVCHVLQGGRGPALPHWASRRVEKMVRSKEGPGPFTDRVLGGAPAARERPGPREASPRSPSRDAPRDDRGRTEVRAARGAARGDEDVPLFPLDDDSSDSGVLQSRSRGARGAPAKPPTSDLDPTPMALSPSLGDPEGASPDPVSEPLPPPRRSKIAPKKSATWRPGPQASPETLTPPTAMRIPSDPAPVPLVSAKAGPSTPEPRGRRPGADDGSPSEVQVHPVRLTLKESTDDPETVVGPSSPRLDPNAETQGVVDSASLFSALELIQDGEDTHDPETIIRPSPMGDPEPLGGGFGLRPFLDMEESTDDPETIIRDAASLELDAASSPNLFLPQSFGEDDGGDNDTFIRPSSEVSEAETREMAPDRRISPGAAGLETIQPAESLEPALPLWQRWWATAAVVSVAGVVLAAVLGGLSAFVGGTAVFGGILWSSMTGSIEARCKTNVDSGRAFVQEVKLRPRRDALGLLDELQAECLAENLGTMGTVFVIIELRSKGEDGILTEYEQSKVRDKMQDWSR